MNEKHDCYREKGCPYENEGGDIGCKYALHRDALALLKAQEPVEARLNLCESCTKEFAECKTDMNDLVFGSGVWNDNIIGCLQYVNRWKAREPVEYIHDADNPEGDVFLCKQCKEVVGENIPGFIGYRKVRHDYWVTGYRKVRHNYCPNCGRAVKCE